MTFLEQEIGRYKDAYDTIRGEVNRLKLSILPSAVPEWRKDKTGKYVYVSPNYEVFILLPLNLTINDVIGKTDAEVFHDYPEFANLMREIDLEAVRSIRKFAVRRKVRFPGNPETHMVIKEISQTIDGVTYFIGRCYPES